MYIVEAGLKFFEQSMSGNLLFDKRKMRERRTRKLDVVRHVNNMHRTWEKGRHTSSISKKHLEVLYLGERKSMQEIADALSCSVRKVVYWKARYKIPSRSRSEATYAKRNPYGDPFMARPTLTRQSAFLAGLGLGLYWGKGTWSGDHAVRLATSDPKLASAFVTFLSTRYSVPRQKLRFGLQVSNGTSAESALQFWQRELRVGPAQFRKVAVTGRAGSQAHSKKSTRGVLTVHCHNKKLKQVLMNELDRVSF